MIKSREKSRAFSSRRTKQILCEHPLDALAVKVVLIPGHGGQQVLEALLGGAGDDLGDGVAVLVGVLGQ
jgi:hypothetical protein